MSEGGVEFATIEHAYQFGDAYTAKVPPGTYKCVRGLHRLHSGPIETFEVMGVKGHKGILFHPGNTQAASEGCILLGMVRTGDTILESRKAFARFMAILAGHDEFTLTVS